MRSNLQLRDGTGVVLEAQQVDPDTIRIYNAAGGSLLAREQSGELLAWLDDGGSSVNQQEVDRLRRELEIVRGDVRRLLGSLKGAWWLEAADTYRKLAEWAA